MGGLLLLFVSVFGLCRVRSGGRSLSTGAARAADMRV